MRRAMDQDEHDSYCSFQVIAHKISQRSNHLVGIYLDNIFQDELWPEACEHPCTNEACRNPLLAERLHEVVSRRGATSVRTSTLYQDRKMPWGGPLIRSSSPSFSGISNASGGGSSGRTNTRATRPKIAASEAERLSF